jgi:hypothetical protein
MPISSRAPSALSPFPFHHPHPQLHTSRGPRRKPRTSLAPNSNLARRAWPPAEIVRSPQVYTRRASVTPSQRSAAQSPWCVDGWSPYARAVEPAQPHVHTRPFHSPTVHTQPIHSRLITVECSKPPIYSRLFIHA